MNTTWAVICRVEDIPMLGARRVQREHGAPVAVFRTGGDRRPLCCR
jgi:nitrite reductase (NADH) small subunit